MGLIIYLALHTVIFACVALLGAVVGNFSHGVGLLFVFGFYGGTFKSINRRLMKLCNISFENKDYHEEDRKREEAERERLKNANRSWFGKFIDRLRL